VETITTIAGHAIHKAECRQKSKQRLNSRLVEPRRSANWELVDSVFTPLHEQISFTLEGCDDAEGMNVQGDMPHCSPSDSISARDLVGERVVINTPWELADEIGQKFEHCRRTTLMLGLL
jgi:hypothetical protein